MNFTSLHFVAFFFITLSLGHVLKGRPQRIFLLLASYYFYGVFEPSYLVLVIFSTAFDYVAGLGITNGRREHASGLIAKIKPQFWLAGSIVVNLALLGYFKYTNFGIEVLNDIHPLGDTPFRFAAADILLPVGISFYTFQSMSYTIDVYRGSLEARRDPVDFALYVTFFPQLVAGPIVRATTFLNQLDNPSPVQVEDIKVGVTRIAVGFFRKLVLSDNLAVLVESVFANPAAYSPTDIWIASLAFGWQIYLDFAGYTDIARGVARLFGYEFEINFLYPMAAGSILDHWSRWHISLTTWLRDYLYIPLGGSKVSTGRTYLNIAIVWLATGIWHGPAYHYIAWGLWQFVMIIAHRLYSATRAGRFLKESGGIPWAIGSRIILFFFLNFGFIWFRARDMATATLMQGRLFGIENLNNGFATGTFADPVFTEFAVFLVLLWAYELVFNHLKLDYFWKPENRTKLILLIIILVFMILTLAPAETPDFIYFQF